MTKKSLLFSLSAILALSASAAQLTPEQALQRARQNGPARVKARVATGIKPVYSAKAQDGTVAAYVFNNPDKGYLILGADDVAYPVLGYSESGHINVDNMSPELKWWLEEYARQIEWAVSKGAGEALKAPGYAVSERPAIPALLETKWNQDAPFYDDCPTTKDGRQCYSGCVATSMAQVMNYHQYPVHGEGIKQYQCTSLGRRLTINFAQKDFDWDNMLDIYESGAYTEEQGAAVAYLMKACGYSVEMNYGPDSSGAVGSIIASALREYFNYDEGCESRFRLIYSGSQWEEMIYNNLKEVGPVILNGQSPLQGGHSFVCDGYDGNGYYHINWGWGGMSDGFFSLDALNPDAQGIGGYTGGFNFSQNAIIGMRPPTGEATVQEPSRILQYGSTVASISGREVTFDVVDYNPLGWGCAVDKALRAKIGAIVEPAEGTSGQTLDVEGKLGTTTEISLSGYGSYYASSRVKPTVNLPSLADGTYRVTLASLDLNDENAQWTPVAVPWGCKNYFMLTVNGSTYTVANVPVATIAISDLELASPLYAGKNALLKATFANTSDIELVQGLSPQLFDKSGKAVFTGESILITLAAGETLEKEWTTRFYNLDGSNASLSAATDFTLKFYDPNTSLYFQGVEIPVTMQPSPGNTTLMLTGFSIANAENIVEATINGQHIPRLALISDKSDIQTSLSFKVSRGFFDGNVSMGISRQNPQNPAGVIPVIDEFYQDMPFLAKDEVFSAQIPVDFSEAEDGVLYYIVANYTQGAAVNSFGRIAFMCGADGVDEIGISADAPETYYNIMGLKIEKPAPGELVIVRKGGKTFKRIWK